MAWAGPADWKPLWNERYNRRQQSLGDIYFTEGDDDRCIELATYARDQSNFVDPADLELLEFPEQLKVCYPHGVQERFRSYQPHLASHASLGGTMIFDLDHNGDSTKNNK